MEIKNKKLIILGMFIVVIAFALISIPVGINKNKLGASVSYSSLQNKVIYFDLESFTNSLPSSTEEYDYMKVAFALQGLINRQQPVLYYKYKSNGFPFLGVNIDDVWLADLKQDGYLFGGKEVVTYTSFDQVIGLANELGVVNGVVLWDPKVPATSNVASTIAGVENLVPIRKDVTNFSCYTDLVVNRNVFGSVQRDLTGKFTGSGYLPDGNLNPQTSGTASTGSAKNDAYRWAKKYYMETNKTSPTLMGYTRDAWIPACSTGACFVDSYLPTTMAPGEEKEVYVTILNNNVNSGEVWKNSQNYRIASNSGNGGHNDFKVTAAEYGFEQGDLTYGVRIYIDPNNDIEVGERQRIHFTIKAPDTAGTYRLNLGFVHDGSGWFNGTLDQTITVSSTSNNRKQEHYGTYPQGIFNAGLNTSDYLIQNKAFFFDLSPDNSIAPKDDRGQTVGTDYTTLTQLLSQQKTNSGNSLFTVIGFVPWFVKYTSTSDSQSSMGDVAAEWKMVDTISSYGGESDADAMAPVGLTNASIFKHATLNTPFTQNNDKEAIKNGSVVKEVYDSNTKYFILYMGDYDCGAWTSGVLPSRFLQENGVVDKYPLTWPVDADLSQRVPQAFNWIYSHQTRNDYFVAGDNGSGYLNPMQTYDLTSWKNHNITMNNNFDLDITGFLIGGNNTISSTVKNAYQEMTPTMVGYQGTLASGSTTTPFIPSANIAPNTSTLGQDIYNQINASSSKFIIIRTIQTKRADAYAAIDTVYSLAAANGKKFKVVDPYTMAYLYKNHPTSYKGCYTDGTNYQWINSSTIPSGYSYVNTVSSSTDCHKPRTKIAKPELTTSTYTFTGSAITPTVNNYDSTKITRTGNASGTNIGNYSTTYAITDKTNYEWTDGSQDNVTLNWSISKLILAKPAISGTSSFTYNGSPQGITVTNVDTNRMTVTGNTSRTNAGNYSVTYSLKDKSNTSWSDGTTTDVTLNWSIAKAKLTKPAISGDNTFTYNGSSQGPSITGFDVNTMTQTGYITRTNAGSYTAIYSIQDTDNYSWSDNSITDVSLAWSIAKATLEKPAISGDSTYTYDGTEKSITVTGIDTDTMTQTGTTAETNAGNYSTTIAITNSNNYEWTDNTITDIVLEWSISKAKLTKPTVNGSSTFTYTGGYQGLSFNDFDSNTMDCTDNNEIQVGSYTATISLKDTSNYSWSDDSIAAQIYAWSITRADLNAAVTMANYYENATPSIPVVTGNTGSGTVTFTYSVRGTGNYSSTVPTTKGLYTVKALIAQTNNYNAAVVTGDFEVLESQSEAIVLPDGSIITDVGLYGELIDSYNAEKGTSYNYTHLFTEQELASLETLVISYDNYHGVEVEDLSDLSYLTGLKNLTINLWENCECNDLVLSSNTELLNLTINSVDPVDTLYLNKNTKLKTLSINDSTINVLNISKSTLDSIDLDKPSNIGYIMLDRNKEVSYLINSVPSQSETISNDSFGITCAKYSLDINESTTCTVKGKTTEQMKAVIFKLMTSNNNISISNQTVVADLEGDKEYLLYGEVPIGEFNILSFTITAVSGGTTKLYLDDYNNQNKIGYVDGTTFDYVPVTEEISKTIYINKYSMSTSAGTPVTSGILQTNYILNIINSQGIYEPAFNISVLGDVKGDGIIDIRDVAKAYDALANGNYMSYTYAEKYALDMNSDGLKSILDLIKIYDAIEE